ncbi:MAG: hypothetical protein D6748_07840, partial [Calditrichaeota bacterium]
YHLGEVFTLLELIYPWESRTWFSLNINPYQSDQLIETHGMNPASVDLIGTAIDLDKFKIVDDPAQQREILRQLESVLAGYSDALFVKQPTEVMNSYQPGDTFQPMLIGASSNEPIQFIENNIILLQPTRILPRKAIEVNFTLLEKLFADEEFIELFDSVEERKLTLLITGPIATGQESYFLELVKKFGELLDKLTPKHRSRVFLGCLFSELDRPSFKKKFEKPIALPDVYNVASLVTLPSETEGRGLPLLEAAASGIPIFCRRYEPEYVYSELIGESLEEDEHLNVIEFTDPSLNQEVIELVKRQLFSPQAFRKYNYRNREVIRRRFSFQALQKKFHEVLYKMYLQITTTKHATPLARQVLEDYQAHLKKNKDFVKGLINVERRQYLPGYGQMAFMIFLKSLIDPSYFRVEEKRIRGMAMHFARDLVENTPDPSPLPIETVHLFYNSIDEIFRYWEGEISIRMDHSLAYRHRNKRYYPYRDLTPQELSGVINMLYNRLASPPPVIRINEGLDKGSDWHKQLAILYENAPLEIDHVDDLEQKLIENIPIALFPGKYIETELEVFVLYPVRRRLKKGKGEKIRERDLQKKKLAPIFIFQHQFPLGNSVTCEVLKSFIFYRNHPELKLLFQYGICKIVPTLQLSVGLHLYELGEEAARALQQVRRGGGILITNGDHAAMMTDILDMSRFHIGKATHILAAKILGISQGSGYVQWVPPGIRFTLAYPTPIQTGKSLSILLKSVRFRKLCEMHGEKKVLSLIKREVEEKGSPVKTILRRMVGKESSDGEVQYHSINGLYEDGLPWAGMLAKVNLNNSSRRWYFNVVSTDSRPKTVLQFLEEFQQQNHSRARVAWNGGYILNPELVGKLGLPEKFVGSPLGLIITAGKVLSLPLFNKPAFLVHPDGRLSIKRVNCRGGFEIDTPKGVLRFSSSAYNCEVPPPEEPAYYDLLYPHDYLPGNGRTLVRLAGNRIKDIIPTREDEKVPVLPVGVTLSLPPAQVPDTWKPGMELEIRLTGWEEIESAIEAGPMLLSDGEVCIDMELEGWTTKNSIRTQAARLDYTDMRGPKIAIGLDVKGDLSILTINGRIRESVGATHYDMARILKEQGMVMAMGFDPGGSSTLVVDNKTLNISPYNHEYEKDVYALPPEPRAVANAVIGWQADE